MKTLLAALDTSSAARPVLETALGMGELTGAAVEAVHVLDGSVETPTWLAAHAGVPLRVVRGPVGRSLLAALEDPSVVMAVLGARATAGGRRPVGRTALYVVEGAKKPVVVVPPETMAVPPRPFRRLLVPLEGTEESARPVGAALAPLLAPGAELLVLHVFTTATAPSALDHPVRDLALWGEEFLARFCPGATSIELRGGLVSGQVAKVCSECHADLVVLSWSQDTSPGHARVVQDVLAHTTVPVLLLPAVADRDGELQAAGCKGKR